MIDTKCGRWQGNYEMLMKNAIMKSVEKILWNHQSQEGKEDDADGYLVNEMLQMPSRMVLIRGKT